MKTLSVCLTFLHHEHDIPSIYFIFRAEIIALRLAFYYSVNALKQSARCNVKNKSTKIHLIPVRFSVPYICLYRAKRRFTYKLMEWFAIMARICMKSDISRNQHGSRLMVWPKMDFGTATKL